MTFLNAALLGGFAAVSIPIVIHWLHRSRHQVVHWGAMHLLEGVLRQRRRRFRLEQILLLLVRCSIPCLLALAMARPVLTGGSALWGDVASSTAVLLDDSYSMEAFGPERSNFVQAREAAVRALDGLSPGSEATVLRMGGEVSELLEGPTFDLPRLKAELARARSGFGRARVPEALEFTRGAMLRMRLAHREVVILSDFQRASWGSDESAARSASLDSIRSGPVPPQIILFHVGREAKDNVCVERLETSRMIPGVGQKLHARATLRNLGESDVSDLKVVFRADGVEQSACRVSLSTGEKTHLLFTHAFQAPGSHVIEVEVDADALRADNACALSLPVWDRLPVLLVSGDTNPEPLRGETDYLEVALRPFGAAREGLADLIQTRVVEPKELDRAVLAETRVVVLANVSRLPDPQRRALEDFVREGGGLLVFAGDRIEAGDSSLGGLLPLPWVARAGSETGARVVSEHFQHPALELFNDPRQGNLSDARFWRTLRIKEPAAGEAAVLARLDSGDPFLVEKSFGEGRVLQCAASCDADDSNLPMRPFYLPLMQQLTAYLASNVVPPRNVQAGRPLVALLPAADAGKKIVMTDPEGRTHDVPVVSRGARGVAEFSRTRAPGLYTLDAPGGPIHFVVHVDRAESELGTLSAPEVEALAESMGARVARSWEEYESLRRERRFGREAWRALLGLLLGLMLLEILLARFAARREA
jgi:hypothetical protein